eukprot:5133764-Heterocapsa_arctica.AAC.1
MPPRRESVSRTGLEITRLTFRLKVELQSMDTLRVRRHILNTESIWPRMFRNTCLGTTYIRYIQHTLVREDALNNEMIKGSPTGKKGRHIIIPEQMGHEVQTCGDYEYCLGCGRTTKAKRSISAQIVQYCKPVMRMKRYRKRNHDI